MRGARRLKEKKIWQDLNKNIKTGHSRNKLRHLLTLIY